MTYRYAWGPRFRCPGLPVLNRKGQCCQLVARGKMNSALVRFADGEIAIVSRNALRRVKPEPDIWPLDDPPLPPATLDLRYHTPSEVILRAPSGAAAGS